MTMEFWEKLAYMVQLLLACQVFMFPIRKRRKYGLLSISGAVFLLSASYLVNTYIGEPSGGKITLLFYWIFFLIFCLCYVWFCAEISYGEVIYCVVCASAMQHTAYDVYQIYFLLAGKYPAVYVMIYGAVYFLYYYFFARKLAADGRYRVGREDIFPMATILLFVWLLTILGRSAQYADGNELNCIIYLLADGLCCYHILWGQVRQREKLRLLRELDGITYVWSQQKEQYLITQETIDIINRKCHDLRHQIRGLSKMTDEVERSRYLQEIEEAVMIYDTAVKTGNAALDTVLMEKGLFCRSHGIQWTCMADGALLDFMEVGDIYAMFGNAIDNAIAAVLELQDKEKRIISIRVFCQQKMIMIQVQNYYEGHLKFIDGLPQTTKKERDFHGYGMKSLRYTAEKYNGTLTTAAENQIFSLHILLPLPVADIVIPQNTAGNA